MKPELLKALEANMFDRHEYEALEAEAFLKGQASGVEKGALQERKKNDAEKLKIADFFRSKGVPEDIVSEGFGLK
ncbi:hypothetical protein [Fibrobacter sp. UWB3]|uniref:hypothetical protein n=1 Tax=Fibrobacter sp. UWB3 TaxID=1964357 RepID=UPI001C3D38F1|nr:hypothetical protein [Fibrobacter sp. UWB3]